MNGGLISSNSRSTQEQTTPISDSYGIHLRNKTPSFIGQDRLFNYLYNPLLVLPLHNTIAGSGDGNDNDDDPHNHLSRSATCCG